MNKVLFLLVGSAMPLHGAEVSTAALIAQGHFKRAALQEALNLDPKFEPAKKDLTACTDLGDQVLSFSS